MSYNVAAIIKAFRVYLAENEIEGDLLDIVGDKSKTAYKKIFKELESYLEDEDNMEHHDFAEICEVFNTLKEKNMKEVSEKKSSSSSKKKEPESDNESSGSEPNLEFEIKINNSIDSSDFPDISYLKNFDKSQLDKIFGEKNIKTIEHDNEIYYEWRVSFNNVEFSVYASDLDEDITWILAGNADTQTVKHLLKMMRVSLKCSENTEE